jgi:peptidylprolyl isomerase
MAVRGRALLTIAVLVASAGCLDGGSDDGPAPEAPPASTFVQLVPAGERPAVTFETTEGDITVMLYPEAAPESVALVQRQAEAGYYAGRAFGRIVPGHVIQDMDVTAATEATAGTAPLETNASYHFSAGAVGFALGADPDAGGAEFFIMDFATSHLHGNFSVWGQVVDGMDVVHRIARGPRAPSQATSAAASLNPTAGILDQMALVPVRILGATVTTLTLGDSQAAKYPYQAAKNARVGDWRHSLEWPNDLRVGQESLLTWYVRPYNGTALPNEDRLQVRFIDAAINVDDDPVAPGKYVVPWTPTTAGVQPAMLVRDRDVYAVLNLTVHA